MKRWCYVALTGVFLMSATGRSDVGVTAVQGSDDCLAGVKKIVFVGDSLMDAAGWPDWVIETLKANGYPGLLFSNAGICADTIAKVKARLKADVLDLKPDLAVICVGVNDVITGVAREQYLKDMGDVLGQLRARNVKVLLLTPPSLEKPEWNAELAARNKSLQDLAAAQACIVGDLHRAFEKAAGEKRRLWGDDGIHHNLEGWRTIGRCALDALGCPAPMVEKCVPYPGSVTNWLISAPVPWKQPDPLPEPDLSPSFDPVKAGWKPFDPASALRNADWWAGCMADRGGVLPLGEPAWTNNAGAFSWATVVSEAGGPATMRVGGSPPLAVWLNGKLVWRGRTAHGYHPDADRFNAQLVKGVNRVVVFSTWYFHVAIRR